VKKLHSAGYRLILDIQATQSLDHAGRGIGRYTAQHARALSAYPGLVAAISLNPLLPFPAGIDQQMLCHELLVWNTKAAFDRAERQGPIAYHIMSPFELNGPPSQSVVPPHAMGSGVSLIVTLYDLIPLTDPSYYLADPHYAKRYETRLELIRQADLVLAISEHTRRDAIRLLGLNPSRVAVIGAGVSGYFQPAAQTAEPARFLKERLPQISKPFVLCVSGMERRKNTPGLIQAFSLIPSDVRRKLQLVIACNLNDEYRGEWLRQAARFGLEPEEIVLTGSVSEATLKALYQTAALFVLPSLYEGFGLPAAEAAACGCPVLVSNTSAMPEVLDFEPATFDPNDPEALSKLMTRSISDHAFREALVSAVAAKSASHTWKAVAEKTVSALERLEQPASVPSRRAPREDNRRPHIALVGPFRPIRSGIADYNWRVASELSLACDLDVVTVGDFDRELTAEIPEARFFSIGALGRTLNPMSYDAIIYTFGNNQHHHRTYEMALRYPGILWLHDVRLSLFYLSYAMSHYPIESWGHFMTGKVNEMYGPRAPKHLVSRLSYLPAEYTDYSMGMTGELVRASCGVILNSEVGRRLLELDLGPGAPAPPLEVIPLAAPPVFSRRSPEPETPPIVVCVGFVAEVKAPDLVMDALAVLLTDCPARLVFVGPLREDLAPELRRYARLKGIDDAVRFTDDLPDSEYWQWLNRASCSVHIRYTTNGESSSGVNDCLAAGVPVITNIPSCLQIPSGVIEFMDSDVSANLLADAIRRILVDSDLSAGRAAAGRRYAEQTNFAVTAQRTIAFAERICSSKR